MPSVPWFLTAFGFGMAIVIFWGAFLGFVNGYNAWAWVAVLITGIAAITLLGLLNGEMDSDYCEPRRTLTRTSSRTVHFERPHKYEEDYD